VNPELGKAMARIFERLTIWTSLGAALAVAIGIPLYHGLTRFYLANSDQDIDLTYQALMLNDGRGLPYHPHTGFGYALLLAPWLSLAHRLNLIELSGVNVLIDSTRFDALYTEVVAAGRLLTIVFGVATMLVFWAVVRLCSRDNAIAAIAAFLFATSLGLGYQFTVLRTELPSMLALLCAFAMVLIATRAGGWKAVTALGVAVFATTFAAMIKVQAILVAPFLVFVPFLFAPPRPAPASAPAPRMIVTCLIVCGAIGGLGLYRLADALAMGMTWTYQAAGLAFLVMTVVIYGTVYLHQPRWTVPALSAMAAGAGAAASLVYISDHWWTLYGITNFVEFMAHDRRYDVGEGTGAMVAAAFSLGFEELHRQIFEFHVTPRDYPLQLVYVGAAVGCLWLLWSGRRQAALRAGYFLAVAFGLIVIFSVRGYAYYYQIYTEPFFILAGAIVAAEALAAIPQRRALGIAACFAVALFIGGSTTRYRLIAPSTGATRGPEAACCSMDYATLIGAHFGPYCAQATVACPLNWDALRAMQGYYLRKGKPENQSTGTALTR
jgi:hypothetical protein